jgi:Zn finger protein HypA/HybF involved in hydrogenase expression
MKTIPDMIPEIGNVNNNNQKFIRRMNREYVVVLHCIDCNYEYGANGLDFYERKCPKCQGGLVGLPFD